MSSEREGEWRMNRALKPSWDERPFCECGRRAIIDRCDELGKPEYGRRYYKCPDLDRDFMPCGFKQWIDKKNLTQSEREKARGELHVDECKETYLQLLENERKTMAAERAERERKLRIKAYDLDVYEVAVKKDEEDIKAHEEYIMRRKEELLAKQEEIHKQEGELHEKEEHLKMKKDELQKLEDDLKLKEEKLQRQEEYLQTWLLWE